MKSSTTELLLELIRVLENMGAHHPAQGARFHTSQEWKEFLEAFYGYAAQLLEEK